ncbi:TraR/DksA C4-type zinc finger protein [Bacillus sp. CGMCC 1.16607]|uniref:TraR/DksA C4-type zinc finger protein n=1 Tax=Bacillus sp. CGMCC 1.16607 TaxID=3351842 RepID=UPI0036257D0F
MLSSKKLSELKAYLMNEKKQVEGLLVSSFDLNKTHYQESLGELSTYDNHPADEGTALYEREKDVALEEHAKLELGSINHALEAIQNGTYGKCEECGKDIPIERLEALPTTTYCIEHSPDQHISYNRPIEEEVLAPPFGRFDMDEKDEDVAFDAEDSWQEVARWGTSETPSDFIDPQRHYSDVYIESDENIGYVEDFENFVGNDMHGNNVTIFPNAEHEKYEQELDEEGVMTTFGDLPAYEHDPYVEKDKEE